VFIHLKVKVDNCSHTIYAFYPQVPYLLFWAQFFSELIHPCRPLIVLKVTPLTRPCSCRRLVLTGNPMLCICFVVLARFSTSHEIPKWIDGQVRKRSLPGDLNWELETRNGFRDWDCDQEELPTDADCGSCQSSFAHMTAHLWQHCGI